ALGVPIAVGAAAMHERDPAAGFAPPPHSSSAPPPPPPPPGDAKADPYAGFRRATRDAYTNASRIARDAMAHANAAVRDVMHKSRSRPTRRLRAWLRAQKSGRGPSGFQALFAWRRRARRAATPFVPARRPRRLWLGVAIVLLALVTLNALRHVGRGQ